ncbi:hypothetical protein ACN4EG_18270 [Alkalinema pantanalense CENA528]|uniref:hypothetical protein n=1 Tax=Alkalinema pantanalense TaxID=1620705 RepID=UPI003D6FA0BE
MFSRLLTIASLTLGLTVSAIAAHPANAESMQSAKVLNTEKAPALVPAVVSPAVSSAPLSDGVYLYGESAQPEVLGKAYFVFEVKQGKVLGALYMPSSSFDCAYGQFQANQLALTVRGAYEPAATPFEIALDRTSVVASNGNPAQAEIGLQGFQRLEKVSENDHRILEMCKANFGSNL